MRKSWMGYNVKEVDEALEEYRLQNAHMLEKNEELRLEVSRLREMVAEGMTKEDVKEFQQIKTAYDALKAEVAVQKEESKADTTALDAEIADLKQSVRQKEETIAQLQAAVQNKEEAAAQWQVDAQQAAACGKQAAQEAEERCAQLEIKVNAANARCEDLGTKLTETEQLLQNANQLAEEYKVAQEQLGQQLAARVQELEAARQQLSALQETTSVDVQEVNDTIKRVCTEITEVKDETYQKMKQNVDDFARKWVASATDMYAMLKELDEARESAERDFFAAERRIAERFEKLETHSAALFQNIGKIETTGAHMRDEMMQMVDHLRKEPLAEEAAPVEDPEINSDLEYLKKRYAKWYPETTDAYAQTAAQPYAGAYGNGKPAFSDAFSSDLNDKLIYVRSGNR